MCLTEGAYGGILEVRWHCTQRFSVDCCPRVRQADGDSVIHCPKSVESADLVSRILELRKDLQEVRYCGTGGCGGSSSIA